MQIEAKGISKWFLRHRNGSNRFYALQDTSLQLGEGGITIVYGPSGSGKTTLLSILSGLLSPASGQVSADGADLYRMEDTALSAFRNRHFGMIPQGQTALGALTVMENVLLPAGIGRRMTSAERKTLREKADALLAELGIAELADILPSELSGGEIRRMAIARALIQDPDVIFADEPTGDLDQENTGRVMKLLRAAADSGHTVFMVTHDRETFAQADCIYQMKDGRLILQ